MIDCLVRFSVSLVALALAAPAGAQVCGTNVNADCELEERAFFDTRAFADTVADTLGGNYVGYGVVLMDWGGEPVVHLSRGEATKATDPEGAQPFGTEDTKARLGSVSKVLTAAVALKVLQGTPGTSVNTTLGEVAPDFLLANLGQRYDDVTLGDLMNHTSGLPRDTNGRQLYELVRDGLADVSTVGNRAYSNVGLVLLGFLIPFVADPNLYVAEETLTSLCDGDLDCVEDNIQQAALNTYVTLADQFLFDPLQVDARCDLSTFQGEAGLVVARSYSNLVDTSGFLGGNSRNACPAGGWAMTPLELALVGWWIGLEDGSLLNGRNRGRMEAPSPNALGWNPPSGSLGATHPLFDRVWTHGGALRNYSSRLIRLPNGMVAAAMVNSPNPGGGSTSVDLRNVLIAGYEAGAAGAAARAVSVATAASIP